MDVYLKTLTLSNNNTVEDVAYPCMKLLDTISKISRISNQFSSGDAINLAKAVVYLNACHKMFGDDLTMHLLEHFNFYKDYIRFYFRNTAKLHAPVARIFENVAQRNNSAVLFCCLESLYCVHSQKEVLEAYSIPSNNYSLHFFENVDSELSEDQQIMLDLLESLLQLPSDQISIAIERILNYIHFNTIGHIFCEQFIKEHYCNDICLIMADKIVQKISNASINKFFIQSLYYTICLSNTGRAFFWKCLQNVQFCAAVQHFLMTALTEAFKDQLYIEGVPEVLVCKEHNLKYILYIAWTALAPQSPCHNSLRKSISETCIFDTVFGCLNNFDSIYDK